MPCFRRVENRIVGNCSTTDVTEDLRHESYCQRAMLMNIICSVNKRWSSVKLLIHREYNMQKAVISKINKDPGSYEIFSGYVFFSQEYFSKKMWTAEQRAVPLRLRSLLLTSDRCLHLVSVTVIAQ